MLIRHLHEIHIYVNWNYCMSIWVSKWLCTNNGTAKFKLSFHDLQFGLREFVIHCPSFQFQVADSDNLNPKVFQWNNIPRFEKHTNEIILALVFNFLWYLWFSALEEWRKRKMERARQRQLEKNGTTSSQAWVYIYTV